MRNVSYTSFLFLFTFLSFVSLGQETATRDAIPSERKLLTQQWTLIYFQGKVNRVYSTKADALVLTFNHDGTYRAHSKRSKEINGTWLYDAKTKTVSMINSKEHRIKIVKLTANRLIYDSDEAGVLIRYAYRPLL